MNAPASIPTDTLPTLIDRAAAALDSARTSAEVLEVRDQAGLIYDAAKRAARIAAAKGAHDDMIGMAYRLQADAALIEARAKVRLADEYDATNHRGVGRPKNGSEQEPILTPDDVGGKKQLHEARRLRDAERAEPGLAERALNAMVERGEEPTRAALRRSVLAAVADARKPDDRRNPNRKPDPFHDKVLTFIDHCEQLAATSDLEAIAAYDDPRFASTVARRDRCAMAALEALTQFMEKRNA